MMNQLLLKEQENENKILSQEKLIEQLQSNNKLMEEKIQKLTETEMQIIIRQNNYFKVIKIKSIEKIREFFKKVNKDMSKYDLAYLGIVLDPLCTLNDYSIPDCSVMHMYSKDSNKIVIFIKKKNTHDFVP